MMAARRKNGKKSFRAWKGLLAVVVLMLTLASTKETLAFMKAQTEAVTNIFDFQYYFALKYDLMGGNSDTQPTMQELSSKDDSVTFDITHKENANRQIANGQMVPEKDGCFFLGWSEEPSGQLRDGWADYKSADIEANVTKITDDISISPKRNDINTSIKVEAIDENRDYTLSGYAFSKTLYAQWGSALIPGTELNQAIKQLSQGNEGVDYDDDDFDVLNIVFARVTDDNEIRDTYGFEPDDGVNVDQAKCGNIRLYYNDSNDTAYILSQHLIWANPDSKYTFYKFFELTSIEFKNFDTSLAQNMSNMFSACEVLPELDLSCFNTANVTDMSFMFTDCQELTDLVWSEKFVTYNVTDMSSMFSHCQKITELNLTNFNTSNVMNMSEMFSHCQKITELELTNFDTGNVTDMSSMFKYCQRITELDLSSFDTSKVTTMLSMFERCSRIKKIYVSDLWNVNSVQSEGSTLLFKNCSTNLVGGQGTIWNASNDGVEYARIDRPDSDSPGYFTYKPLSTFTTFSLDDELSDDKSAEDEPLMDSEAEEIILDDSVDATDSIDKDDTLPNESEDSIEQLGFEEDAQKEVAP